MSKDWFKLSHGTLIVLFTYYAIIFFGGMIVSVLTFLRETTYLQSLSLTAQSMTAGVGMAFLGSSISYIRKLYKACIRTDISNPTTPEDTLRQIGLTVYFVFRPLFAVAFALLIMIGIKASVFAVTPRATELDDGFIFFIMFISFFAGFSAGDLLDVLEQTGQQIMKRLFDTHGGNDEARQ